MARAKRKKGGGLGRVAEAAAKKGKTDWVKWEDGDVKYVRVVGPWVDAYTHRVKMTRDDDSSFHADVPCLDQDEKGKPCPGCAEDLDRRFKFWTNVIVRGDEDASEKADQRDHMAIWSGGITVAKVLDKMDAKKGIKSRDLEVEREGSGKNDTSYDIDWATDDEEPLSDEDEQLVKSKLFDLSRYAEPPDFDDFFEPRKRKDDDDDEDSGNESLRRRSAFNKRKRNDDDDDEDESPRRRRSSSGKSKKTGLGSMKAKKDADAKKSRNSTTVRRRRTR